jgi:hypothetical protein
MAKTTKKASAAEILAEEMTLQKCDSGGSFAGNLCRGPHLKGNWLFQIGNHSDTSISALRDYDQTFGGKIKFYARFKKRGARGSLVRIRPHLSGRHTVA